MVDFTVAQLAHVGVAIKANLGVLIQGSGIGNDDLVVGLQRVAESLGESNIEGIAIGSRSSDGIVGSIHSGAVQGDAGDAAVGQTGRHFIMEHIILGTGLSGDGGLEVHGLADVGVVLLAVIAGGIFLNGLDVGGYFVLFFHDNIGIGGIQRAQRTQRGVHQVVAQLQILELHSRVGFFLVSSRGSSGGISSHLGSFNLSQLGKGGCVSILDPSHIALSVKADIGSLGFQPGFPCAVCFVSIGTSVLVIALQIQNLISLINLSGDSVIDGDGAAGQGSLLSRKGRDGQGKGQSQGQQQTGQFLCVLHNLVSFPAILFLYLKILFKTPVKGCPGPPFLRGRIRPYSRTAAAIRHRPPAVYHSVPPPPVDGSS